jgi:hypothetical protein
LALLTTGNTGEAAAAWRTVIESCEDPEILLEMMKLFRNTGDGDAERRAMERMRQIGNVP